MQAKSAQGAKQIPLFHEVARLLNPAGAHHHLIGVSHPPYLSSTAEALLRIEPEARALVFRGLEGDAELLATNAQVTEVRDGISTVLSLRMDAVGLAPMTPTQLSRGTVEDEVKALTAICQGTHEGPHEAMVCFNAALGLYVTGGSSTIAKGLAQARDALRTGGAWRILESCRRSR